MISVIKAAFLFRGLTRWWFHVVVWQVNMAFSPGCQSTLAWLLGWPAKDWLSTSHELNLCGFVIIGVLWHSTYVNSTGRDPRYSPKYIYLYTYHHIPLCRPNLGKKSTIFCSFALEQSSVRQTSIEMLVFHFHKKFEDSNLQWYTILYNPSLESSPNWCSF